MKVIAFNSSARKNGNTEILLKNVLEEIKKEGIQTESISLAGEHLKGCAACLGCFKRKDNKCAVTDDKVNEFIEKMISADGIILGSPTYFADMTANLKALIERAGFVSIANGGLLKRKLGAAVVAVRRGGAAHVFSSINYFFTISEMIIVGSSYWNDGIGMNKGDVNNDAEGLRTMKNLGINMTWLLKKINQ